MASDAIIEKAGQVPRSCYEVAAKLGGAGNLAMMGEAVAREEPL